MRVLHLAIAAVGLWVAWYSISMVAESLGQMAGALQ